MTDLNDIVRRMTSLHIAAISVVHSRNKKVALRRLKAMKVKLRTVTMIVENEIARMEGEKE